MDLPNSVKVVEVGLRDGLQTEKRTVPSDLKIWAADRLVEAGLQELEVTSFVHPKIVPQLADAADVLAGVARTPGVRFTALVPNLKGAQRALDAGADVLRLVICASETFNRKNVGLTIDDSLADLERILGLRAERGGTPVAVAIGLALGCPFEGDIPRDKVLSMLRQLVDLGVDELCVADSAGLAHPRQVEAMVAEALPIAGGLPFSLHLHDTRGLGLANALAAMQQGVRIFDASIGGLGGCPTNPAATGNIPTEDLVNLCEEMGVATGVDLVRVREVTRRMQRHLERDLPSHVLAMGTREELYARNNE